MFNRVTRCWTAGLRMWTGLYLVRPLGLSIFSPISSSLFSAHWIPFASAVWDGRRTSHQSPPSRTSHGEATSSLPCICHPLFPVSADGLRSCCSHLTSLHPRADWGAPISCFILQQCRLGDYDDELLHFLVLFSGASWSSIPETIMIKLCTSQFRGASWSSITAIRLDAWFTVFILYIFNIVYIVYWPWYIQDYMDDQDWLRSSTNLD